MTTLAKSTSVPGTFAGESFLAALTVLVLIAGLWVLISRHKNAPHGGLVTGADNRRSTSKTIAVAWTVVTAWMVLTEAYVAIGGAATFHDLLQGASDLYFVLLGGPYAAAAFAKAATQSKVSAGTLSKPVGRSGPKALDVIADDNGNVDLYDFQYTLFNALALLIVVFTFVAHPGHGLPDIPQFLAVLTGGSALTYTVNKSIAADGPQITSVHPPKARIGDKITITGVQLLSGVSGTPLPKVTIGGVDATGVAVSPNSSSALVATVVGATDGEPLRGPSDVTVTPATGAPIVSREGVDIVADELEILDVVGQPFGAQSTVTVHGRFLLTPGTAAGSSTGAADVGGLKAALTVGQQNWPISFLGRYSDTSVELHVGDAPTRIAREGKATLTLARDPQSQPKTLAYKID